QRGRDHPPRTLAREIIERDHDLVVVLPNREPANICHGVPSFSAHGRSVFSNREGTPPTPSSPSTTSGYSSLLAVEDGYRESTESWAAVMRDLKHRGVNEPKLVVGDGALGTWAALRDVFP